MVVAANGLATDAGYRILKAGGSAVDAAIAVQMVLTLVEPQSSGIGGGAFMLHFDGDIVTTFDGRETAPADV
jgi:gamma-glutamyltranspeptidase/glutathione hydrolase